MSNSTKIAQLNDEFRQGLSCCVISQEHLMLQSKSKVSGTVVMTHLIDALSMLDKVSLMEKVINYSDFTPDNDPYGEHDFGSFMHNKEKVFWKFDYYDKTLKWGSEDPSDNTKTKRVLTVMLASEY